MGGLLTGTGTDESLWRSWPTIATWPELPLPTAAPLVVAPHPDDEVLGVGGLLNLAGAAEVVAVTDGEASHPDSAVHRLEDLASIRRAETAEALLRLGLRADVHRLGHPDGDIDEDALAAQLAERLTAGRWCLATWASDGHPDHEAAGRAAAAACRATNAVLLEYPIWAWHWAEPGDARVPWHRAHRVDLPGEAQAAKARAVAAFRSQIAALGPGPGDGPVLPPSVLAKFARPYEVVFA
ncbi:PIG-L deacetylase family protein [Micromonospora sp. NPDC005806]|uniref:PIG-L deacetylase family protein n=1 Tax=Micromonospora sp. NPDC005806 TaxID=3364234 RepID=UPI0036BF4B4C